MPSELEAGDIILPPPQRPEQPVQRAVAPYVQSAVDAAWNEIIAPPGRVMQQKQPQAGEMYSDEQEAIRQLNVGGELTWGAKTGLSMVGTPGVPGGALGSSVARGAAKGAEALHAGDIAPGSVPAFLRDIRRPGENIDTVLESNFNHGREVGNDVASVSDLAGGVSVSATDAKKVKSLVERMGGPDGYWERPIVDDAGNVIEGAHRIEAARQMGLDSVPIYRVKDLERGLPIDRMRQAIKDVAPTPSDHVHQIMGQTLEMIHEAGGPQAALQGYEFPAVFKSRFEAALNAAAPPQGGWSHGH